MDKDTELKALVKEKIEECEKNKYSNLCVFHKYLLKKKKAPAIVYTITRAHSDT